MLLISTGIFGLHISQLRYSGYLVTINRVRFASMLLSGDALVASRNRIAERWCPEVYEVFFNGSYVLHLNGLSEYRLGAERLLATGLVSRGAVTRYVPKLVRMWRTLIPYALREIHRLQELAVQLPMHIYTFGVFQGDSLYYHRRQFPHSMLLNFDSFVGLPDESPGEIRRSGWSKGACEVDGSEPSAWAAAISLCL